MSTQTSLDGPVNLQVIVPEITQRISGSAPASFRKDVRMIRAIEDILIILLAILSGMLIIGVVFHLTMENSQKEMGALRREIRELTISNLRLAEENKNIHPTTFNRSGFSDEQILMGTDRVHIRVKAGLVFDMRKYTHQHLPLLRVLLGRLRRRNITATFIFDSTFSKPRFKPKIFDQLSLLGHEVGLAEKMLEHTADKTLILTSIVQNNGREKIDGLRLDPTRRLDQKYPIIVLQNSVQDTQPGDVVLVDPLNQRAVNTLMNSFPHRFTSNCVRMVNVSELLRQRDRPST